jgi:heptosyltransferase-2
VILATPLIEKLHHFFPDAGIDFLLKDGYQPLLRNHPCISNLIAWDKKEDRYKNLKEVIQFVREQHYDTVINIQRFAASGLITVLSGAKNKIGFGKNPFSFLYSHKVKHVLDEKGGMHEVDRNLQLIEHLTDGERFPVKLYPTKHDDARMSQYKTHAYITLSPGSLWFTKTFPEDKWVEFISSVNESVYVYLLGSGQERDLCDRIIKQSGRANCLNLAGKLSFLESAVLMKDAQMNYVNDSAPMHLASSVNAPVTAVFCSTVPEFGFGPLSERSFIVQTKKELSCRPCGIHGRKKCPKHHFDCAYTIDNEQLLEQL